MTKKKRSITAAVFFISVITLFFSFAFYLIITNSSLVSMVNKNKSELINYRIDGITGILDRKNDRLKLSENIPVYQNSFQESALFEIHKTYCTNLEKGAFFKIVSRDGKSLEHSTHKEIMNKDIPGYITEKIVQKNSGEFTDKINGIKYWFVFKYYPVWDWFVIYSIPLKNKYSDILPFYMLAAVSAAVPFIIGMLFLSLFVYRSLLPVVKLTKAAEAISSGDLDYAINYKGNDEIAGLAQNFDKMRISIKDKITELEKTMNELKRSNEDLEQYAYASSHDLKEPLRILRLYSDLLIKKHSAGLDSQALEMLGFISTAAQRMNNQIKGILEYAKSGRFEKGVETVNIKGIIEEAVRFSSEIHEKALFSYTGGTYYLECDSLGIQQVFSNLLENAVKYNKSEVPEVKISAEEKGGFVEFSVSDNGIGIDSNYFNKIFEIFETLHPKDEYPGTGIGLALCKKVVERHGGTIRVESPGEGKGGSTFKFTLPLKQHKENSSNTPI